MSGSMSNNELDSFDDFFNKKPNDLSMLPF
jgi:hypothetical protein